MALDWQNADIESLKTERLCEHELAVFTCQNFSSRNTQNRQNILSFACFLLSPFFVNNVYGYF